MKSRVGQVWSQKEDYHDDAVDELTFVVVATEFLNSNSLGDCQIAIHRVAYLFVASEELGLDPIWREYQDEPWHQIRWMTRIV